MHAEFIAIKALNISGQFYYCLIYSVFMYVFLE